MMLTIRPTALPIARLIGGLTPECGAQLEPAHVVEADDLLKARGIVAPDALQVGAVEPAQAMKVWSF